MTYKSFSIFWVEKSAKNSALYAQKVSILGKTWAETSRENSYRKIVV
ncbi:MAG: hypothetical protein SWX82_03495 [Cyanobacteriota bacterium]|nr:hypothetical protein [Cyanobacteriota bacterium]